MRTDINIKKDNSSLIVQHLDLLERMGWWPEAEQVLYQHCMLIFDKDEFNRRLSLIKEKQKIYRKISAHPRDGKSFIGEDDIVRLVKGPITIIYHLKDRHIDIEGVYRSLLQIMETVEDRLSYVPVEVFINLHGEHSELRVCTDDDRQNAKQFAGRFDGSIHLRSSAFHHSEPQRLTVIISHEYVHQAIRDICARRCPRWLDEGLAVYFSQELSSMYMNTLTHAVDEDRFFPIEALEGGALFDADSAPAALAYAQSSSLAAFLLNRIDWAGIQRLLKLMRTQSPETALHEFSLNYYLLEREWKRWFLSCHKKDDQ
jgi:hypothetical protein